MQSLDYLLKPMNLPAPKYSLPTRNQKAAARRKLRNQQIKARPNGDIGKNFHYTKLARKYYASSNRLIKESKEVAKKPVVNKEEFDKNYENFCKLRNKAIKQRINAVKYDNVSNKKN